MLAGVLEVHDLQGDSCTFQVSRKDVTYGIMTTLKMPYGGASTILITAATNLTALSTALHTI